MKEKTNRLWLVVGLLAIADLFTLGVLATVYTTSGPAPFLSLSFFATPTASPTQTVTPSPSPSPSPTAPPTPIPSPTPIPAIRVESGDRALFNSDWERALEEYGAAEAAAAQANDAETRAAALVGLGRSHYETGNYAAALDILRAAADTYPDSPHRPAAFFFLGKTFSALDRYAEAAEAYQNYVSLRPGLIDAYVFELRGDALSAAGNHTGALTDYQAALQSARLTAGIGLQIKMARMYAIIGDAATAIVMYNDIYSRASDDATKARVDYLLGQTYASIGQTEQAYTAYLDAVQNYPLAYDAYLSLVELVNAGYPVDELSRGLVDYYAGEYQVAIQAFDRYLAASPANPATALYYKGLSLWRLSDYAGAIQQWDVVIQNHNESNMWDNAWEQKAYTQWYFLDQYPEATQTLVDFVAKAPWHSRGAEFLFDAGRVAERDGKLGMAAQLWERVANEFPGSDYAFRSLFLSGICRYRQEDYAGALGVFQDLLTRAVDIGQKANAYLWIGKAQNALGDAAAARSSWEQAAVTDPTGYYSERARDILRGVDPFTPPKLADLAIDRAAERAEAEAWMRATFHLPAEIDLSNPGSLVEDPRYRRGMELWQLGLYVEARDEFESLRVAVEEDPASSYRLANILVDLGLYRSGILAARRVLTLAGMDDAATMNAPVYFNHIRFGTYFSDLIVPASQAYRLDPLLLFSIVRQESFFEGFANSSAGARGLMQIIPSTGQGIASQAGWPPDYTAEDLYRPVVSITFGADYLRTQIDYLDGDLYAALAAYNGGPGNALEWKKFANNDPDLFLEIVRFDETRLYIRNIYEIYAIYSRIYDRTP
jgi:soluble lytic murein transglycosylase